MTELILSEIAQMSKNVTDLSEIASHINRVHKTKYTANDILRIQNGKAPRHKPKFKDSAPVVLHESNAKSAPPIGWVPPISSVYGGKDPLAVATNAYIERNRAKIEALAR